MYIIINYNFINIKLVQNFYPELQKQLDNN